MDFNTCKCPYCGTANEPEEYCESDPVHDGETLAVECCKGCGGQYDIVMSVEITGMACCLIPDCDWKPSESKPGKLECTRCKSTKNIEKSEQHHDS